MTPIVMIDQDGNVLKHLNFDGEIDELMRHLNQYKFVLFQDDDHNDHIFNTNNVSHIFKFITAKDWTLEKYIDYLTKQSNDKIINDHDISNVLGEDNSFKMNHPQLIGMRWNKIPDLKNFKELIKDQDFIGLMSSYFDIDI